MKNLILDLDGTIIDVSEKYFQTYKYLLSKEGKKYLSKADYWTLKRTKISELDILLKTGAETLWAEYPQKRKEIFETKDFVKYDKLFLNVEMILKRLNKTYQLVLVTLRHNPLILEWELNHFNLKNYFKFILSGSNVNGMGHQVKKDLLISNKIDNIEYIIGDMPTDIKTGQLLGVKTIALSSGLCNEDILKKYNPTYTLKNINDIFNVL